MSIKLINGFQRYIMFTLQCSLLLTCVEASSTAVPVTTSVATADPVIAPVPTATVTVPQPSLPSQSLSPDEKLQQLHDQIDEANNNLKEQAHQKLVASITDKHKKCAELEINVKRLKKKYSSRINELNQLKATIVENEEKLKVLIGG